MWHRHTTDSIYSRQADRAGRIIHDDGGRGRVRYDP